MKIAFLYTNFPKPSETFLQREARALIEMEKTGDAGVEVEFFSILCGGRVFEGKKIHRMGIADFVWAALIAPLYLVGRVDLWKLLFTPRRTSWENLGENLAGMAAGLVWGRELKKFDWAHAQWGTAPAAAAVVAHRMCGVAFSMGLHAYDLYENGGDGWLEEKTQSARGIISSNIQAHEEVRRRFAGVRAVVLRRGLETVSPERAETPGKIKLISVGRLLAKKGFEQFIEVASELRNCGVKFEARIVGEGPERRRLEGEIERLGVWDCVKIEGWLSEKETLAALAAADFLLFTGKVAPSGDRDGFPNVIAEAFACGAVVLAQNVAGVAEGVIDGQTGVLMTTTHPEAWAREIVRLSGDAVALAVLRRGARQWVQENFDAKKNTARLVEIVREWRG